MPSRAKTLRDAIYQLMVTDFNTIAAVSRPSVKASWLPHIFLRDLEISHPNGIVWVSGGQFGTQATASRNNMSRNEQTITVGYQRKLTEQLDTPEIELEIEQSIEHTERMLKVVKDLSLTDTYGYSWSQSSSELDEFGKPYHYLMAREVTTFESYFNISYINTIMRSE